MFSTAQQSCGEEAPIAEQGDSAESCVVEGAEGAEVADCEADGPLRAVVRKGIERRSGRRAARLCRRANRSAGLASRASA